MFLTWISSLRLPLDKFSIPLPHTSLTCWFQMMAISFTTSFSFSAVFRLFIPVDPLGWLPHLWGNSVDDDVAVPIDDSCISLESDCHMSIVDGGRGWSSTHDDSFDWHTFQALSTLLILSLDSHGNGFLEIIYNFLDKSIWNTV